MDQMEGGECGFPPEPSEPSQRGSVSSAGLRAQDVLIYLVGDSAVQLCVEGVGCVSVQELGRSVREALHIPESAQDAFAFWLCSPLLELQLKPKHQPYKLCRQWQDLLYRFTEATDEDISQDEPCLQYRRNVFYHKAKELEIEDEGVLRLLYDEAKANILEGRARGGPGCQGSNCCHPPENRLVSEFLDSSLWQLLWFRVGVTLEQMPPNREFLSLSGLQIFLSLALFVFIREPYSCVPLFSNSNTKSLPTLRRLLTADCTSEKEILSEQKLSHPWSDPSPNSLSVMSCHLLCFPFALEVPDETMAKILLSYHSCDIVSHLLQLALGLPLCLLELPLSLLCHLLLCDPGRSVPCFTSAAEACGFFLPPGGQDDDGDKPQSASERGCGETGRPSERTASSLLAGFLQSETLSGSAVELISLVSQAARFSLLLTFSVLYVDPSLLRSTLAHPDDLVRAATCSLLGNLNPLVPHCDPLLLPLFQDMTGQLHDPSLAVRRAACRAVGNWLGLVGQAYSRDGSELTKEDGGSVTVEGKTKVGKKRPSVLPGREDPASRSKACVEQEVGRWAESAQGATPVLLPLLRDPDPLIRRHCCAALGNMAAISGGGASLLQCDAPSLLLQLTCGLPECSAAGSPHQPLPLQSAGRTAADGIQVERICNHRWHFLLYALVSLDIEEKLQRISQYTSSACQYNRLMNKLQPQ
ncbi:hypothetical protein SKAU_G00267610 [Synaphobranchus kaupii]|uniref:non-specific serine/threonine protein kinase n=1 Tax=Synaphobranchus kaupii TaxID=118154 RepID=A0A9Q1EZM0_SYNKA|nr:hypothetical protein SKAU_G00267610 [Synaphobranchus kaupii]